MNYEGRWGVVSATVWMRWIEQQMNLSAERSLFSLRLSLFGLSEKDKPLLASDSLADERTR